MSPAETTPSTWTPGGLWPACSRAEVGFLLGEGRDVQRTAGRLFGGQPQMCDYAGLAGAPDDARVELSSYRGQLYLELSDPVANRYRAHLYVRHAGASLIVVKAGFHIHLRSLRRRGLGLRIFHRQLENATALGVDRIRAVAGRRHDENGYYTWPRFGFEGRLPERIRARLPLGLEHSRTVLDLMACEKGRLWWREHGCTIRVEFDATEHSRSRRVFQRYLQEKAASRDVIDLACRQATPVSEVFRGVSVAR